MLRYIGRRLLSSVPVIVGVTTLVFLLIHLIPGDPVDIMLGDSASSVDREALRAQLGLNLPLMERYVIFWKGLLVGDWGRSLAYDRSVLGLLVERFPLTLLLACTSLAVAIVISVPVGTFAARRAGTWRDTLAMALALLGMSVPIYVIAPLAVLAFSIRLRWLPVAGAGDWTHLVLPSLCLGIGLSGILTRIVRTALLEVLREDFVRTARAKGLSESKILYWHALRNAFVPILTILGNLFGGLLAGAVLTETLFDWPGVGKLFHVAFQARDYPLVQGIVLWISLSYVAVNLAVDLLYSWADPRIRWEEGA